jgi:hypothetical protein
MIREAQGYAPCANGGVSKAYTRTSDNSVKWKFNFREYAFCEVR